MAHGRERNLRDVEIHNYLNESEFEDDDTDDEYSADPVAFQNNYSSSESSDEDTTPEDLAPQELSNRPSRGRVRSNRGRNSLRRGSGVRHRGLNPRRSLSNRNSVSSSSNGQREWEEKEFSPSAPHLSQPNYLPINSRDFSRLDYFGQYIDDELIDLMVTKTNQTSI